MTETSLQTVLGLAGLDLPLRFAVELLLMLAAALIALAVRRRRRRVGPYGLLFIALAFLADVLMHLASRHSELAVSLEALGLVLFFFGVIRLALDLVDSMLPARARASNIFWDLLMLLLYAVVLMVVLRATMRVDLSSLLATSAVVSVILGFGLQDTLGNIFSGLTMQLQKPFVPGDWVRFGNHLGRVHGIGWRATRLITRSNERLEIPNSMLSKDMVINYTHTHGAVGDEVFIGLPYEQPPNQVKEILLTMLRSVPEVAPAPMPEVHVVEYGDSAIKYRLRFWLTDYGREEEVRDVVVSNLWYALRRRSIEIPFPIHTVHLHQAQGAGDLRAAQEHRLLAELRGVDFLSQLSDEDLRTLLPNCQIHQFGRGETLMHEGEAGDYFHILRRGKVEVQVKAPAGGTLHIRELTPPAFFGEIALLTGDPRTASIVAHSDVEVLELNREALSHLFRTRPATLDEVSRVVETRISETRQRVAAAPTEHEHRRDRHWLLGKMRKIFDI